jgi:chemotaxis protein CheX
MSIVVPDLQLSEEAIFAVPFVDAAKTVFRSMLDVVCVPGEVQPISRAQHSGEITAAIGMSGQIVGAIAFSTRFDTACRILEQMTGMQTESLDEFVRDSIGEMANMIAGYGKRKLQQWELNLGLPQVIVGDHYDIYAPRWAYHVWVPLESEIGPAALEIGFDRHRRGKR